MSEALGKVFVECRTRQSLCRVSHSAKSPREQYIGKGLFAEYFFSGTRHRICRLPGGTRQRKAVVTAPGWRRRCLCRVSPNTLGKEVTSLPTSLPSTNWPALGKESVSGSLCQVLCRVICMALGKAFFAECPTKSTRQRAKHSAKPRIPVMTLLFVTPTSETSSSHFTVMTVKWLSDLLSVCLYIYSYIERAICHLRWSTGGPSLGPPINPTLMIHPLCTRDGRAKK
jgi:hypothetical protein